MTLVALAFFGFGVTDLVRGPLEKEVPAQEAKTRSGARAFVTAWRDPASAVLGGAIAAALSAFSGAGAGRTALVFALGCVTLGVWVALDAKFHARNPLLPLAWIATAFAAFFAANSLDRPVGDPLGSWYRDLGFAFVGQVSAEQFMLACGAALFAFASCNRVIALVLQRAGTPPEKNPRFRGGRILGPLERLVVGAVVLAGDPAAAAIVIAAKGLLRFPAITSTEQDQGGPDDATEYFLVGTLTSLVLAGLLALSISAFS